MATNDDDTVPNLPRAANDDKGPDATSAGNEGARGSRGQANSGAQPANSSNGGGDQRAPEKGADLRRAPGHGGGGAGSDSSRSR